MEVEVMDGGVDVAVPHTSIMGEGEVAQMMAGVEGWTTI
jgi:hypothetical protein